MEARFSHIEDNLGDGLEVFAFSLLILLVIPRLARIDAILITRRAEEFQPHIRRRRTPERPGVIGELVAERVQANLLAPLEGLCAISLHLNMLRSLCWQASP